MYLCMAYEERKLLCIKAVRCHDKTMYSWDWHVAIFTVYSGDGGIIYTIMNVILILRTSGSIQVLGATHILHACSDR